MSKLLVLNPFGTDRYDEVIKEILEPVKRSDTEFDITHLKRGPEYFDFWYFRQLAEVDVIEEVIKAEQNGYDGVYIACSYEPGVKEAREVVDIPVVGATVPTVLIACQLGHRFSYFTDSELAVTNTWDLLRRYGLETRCLSVKSVGLWLDEIVKKPEENRERIINLAKKAVQEGADVIILGCTIVAAYLTDIIKTKMLPPELTKIAILDSNICAFKTLELLVDLRVKAGISVSRKAYYAKPQELKPKDFIRFRKEYGL